MSWYRDVYLKSEDWRNLRAAVILHPFWRGQCFLCFRKRPLDVHHFAYRRLYDVKLYDLAPVCRDCHKEVHRFLKWWTGSTSPSARRRAVLDQFAPIQTQRGRFIRCRLAIWRVMQLSGSLQKATTEGIHEAYGAEFKNLVDKWLPCAKGIEPRQVVV